MGFNEPAPETILNRTEPHMGRVETVDHGYAQ